MKPLAIKACAKINLGLLITGRRPDGYHTLETVFAPVNWLDILEFSVADSVSMVCSNRELPVDESNLCIRAARALQEFTGVRQGVRIALQKQIPFGAGLGGGSSDAATTLKVLNELWGVRVPEAELHRLAVKLGADVPYFLGMKGLAYAAGIGEQLEDLGIRLPYHIVTVFPGEPVSTVWAYRNFYPRFDRQVPDLKILVRQLCEKNDRSVLDVFENDFQQVVFDHYPIVRQVREELLAAGSFFSSLSGSGSAVFGLFDDTGMAEAAAAVMGGRYSASLTPSGFAMEQ